MNSFFDVEVGDTVVINYRDRWLPKTVEGVTATRFTIEGGDQFMKETGRRFGDSTAWHPVMAYPLTEKTIQNVEQTKADNVKRAIVHTLQNNSFTLDEINRIAATINKIGEERNEKE